jgi:N utilization substance protein A
MMNNELLTIVKWIERERGVDREIVLTAIEQAIQQAAKRNSGVTNDLRVAIDRKDLSLHVYDTLVVSDEDSGLGFISLARARRIDPNVQAEDTIEIELPASRLGRIAAQMSRQLILQKIREAERTNVFTEFKSRVGEIVSGTVTAISKKDIYVLVGKTEMILPSKERIPTEDYQVGDSIRAIVHKVKAEANSTGPSVILSRASSDFLRMLFRLEVSEISDGVVEIMGVARDPGYRAKIAVRTLDENVDPVGACVGLRGARVRNIVTELSNEKIDIVRWSEDPKNYITQALAPAKLESVEIDPDFPSTIHVTVAPAQYSLAIGKRGQNVRLTSRLTGWHVDVTKAVQFASFEEQKAAAIKTLAETFSIPSSQATQLANAGFLSVEGILDTDEAGFKAATGFDEITASGIYAAARAVAEITGVSAPEVEIDDEEVYDDSEGEQE